MSGEVPAVRSVLAVGAGFFSTAVLSLGGDLFLRATMPESFDVTGRVQSGTVLLFMLAYVAGFGLLGGYIAARLAQRRPYTHALVLGLICLAITLAGAILAWDTAPAWYHMASSLLVVPVALLGAMLRQKTMSS